MKPCASLTAVESHSQQEFWIRLEKFVDSWIDGDGHAILNFHSVLVDVRAMVPELELVVSSLRQSVYDAHMTTGERYLTGIASVRLHEVTHASLVKELHTNSALREAGVYLAPFGYIGRGFRAREIKQLLRESFVALHSHFPQRLQKDWPTTGQQ
jgi:hypothetical protein